MEYKLLKRDLISEMKRCDFCHKPLNSYKAYVLRDLKSGEIILAGPKCARNHINKGESLDECPDFTNFTITIETHDGGGHGNIDRQKEGINGWLDKIHGVVRLK